MNVVAKEKHGQQRIDVKIVKEKKLDEVRIQIFQVPGAYKKIKRKKFWKSISIKE